MAGNSDACVKDLVNLLRYYESGVEDVLYDGADVADELATEKMQAIQAEAERKASSVCFEDEERVQEAKSNYLNELSKEQENWYKRETDIAKEQGNCRRSELEVVEKVLAEQGLVSLDEALHERCEQHLSLLTPEMDSNSSETRLAQADRAQQEWTSEVCKAVVMEMRKEWRGGQRKVLQQLDSQLRAERKAAADSLDKQIQMSRKVSETVKGLWANEIQEAQEELDQVSEAFKKALKLALEARLREARQHCKEQAEFFQKEIRDALVFEQQEASLHRAQLRRMKLAMLKWRFDYLQDASKKAAELVARGILGQLSAAHLQVADVENTEADNICEECGHVVPVETKLCLNCGKEYEFDEIKAAKNRKKSKASDGDSSEKGKKVAIGNESGDEGSETHQDDGGNSNQGDISDERFLSCQTVLDKIWSRLATRDEAATDFLLRLEALIPDDDEEILVMYEDELQRHGVVVALDATDGRAEEALAIEREEALAAATQDVQVEERREPRKKKNVKPAVPTVRKRVDLNA